MTAKADSRRRKSPGRCPRLACAAFTVVLGLLILAPGLALAQHTLEPGREEKALEASKILMGRSVPADWAAWLPKMREVWKSQIVVDAYAAARGLKRRGAHYMVLSRGTGLDDASPVREVAVAGGLLNPESRHGAREAKVATLSMHGLAVDKYAETFAAPESNQVMGGTTRYICPALRIEVACNWSETDFDSDTMVKDIIAFGVVRLAEINALLGESFENTVTITCTMEYYKPLVLQFPIESRFSSLRITGKVYDEVLEQTINYAGVEVKYQGLTSGKRLTRDGKYDITLDTQNPGEARHQQIDLALTPEMFRLRLHWGVIAGSHKGWTERYYLIPKSVNALRIRGVVYAPNGQPAPGAHVNCKSQNGPRVDARTKTNGEFELYRTFNRKGFMGMTLPVATFRVCDEDAAEPEFESPVMSPEDLEWAMKLADARKEILDSYQGKIDQKMFNKLAGIYKGINVYDVLTSENPDPREYAKLKKLLQEDLKGKELEIGLKLLTEPAKRVFGNVSTVDKYWNHAKSFFGVKTKKTPQVNHVADNLKKALSRIAEFKAIEKEI